MNIKTIVSRSVSAAALLGGLSAQAFPIAPLGTEGLPVIASGGDDVIAVYEGNSASFNNYLYLEMAGAVPGLDGDESNDLFIFFNHGNAVGDTVNLGSFAAGTELVFRLYVSNTGNNFYSGDPIRNPDGKPHARVQENWEPNTTLVSFEDLLDTPEYPGGFNDLSFSFSNTQTTPPNGVPDPASTLGLFSFAVAGLLGWKSLRKR